MVINYIEYPSVADNCRSGGDPVAILEKQKTAPKGGFLT
jgi:hypothetical protein